MLRIPLSAEISSLLWGGLCLHWLTSHNRSVARVAVALHGSFAGGHPLGLTLNFPDHTTTYENYFYVDRCGCPVRLNVGDEWQQEGERILQHGAGGRFDRKPATAGDSVRCKSARNRVVKPKWLSGFRTSRHLHRRHARLGLHLRCDRQQRASRVQENSLYLAHSKVR